MVNNTALKSNEPFVNYYNNNTNFSNETLQTSCLFQNKDSHNLVNLFNYLLFLIINSKKRFLNLLLAIAICY
jgi:hypothetical protein